MAVEDRESLGRLLTDVLPRTRSLGVVGDVDVRRWEDPSGARLVMGLSGGEVLDLVPSFAAPLGAHLQGVTALNPEFAGADVVDQAGETLTRLCISLEEARFLADHTDGPDGPAAIVSLGVDVSLHADPVAFHASPASLVSPEESDSEPPPGYVERGLKWPPRMGSESFISFGLFDPPGAQARLHGTVLDSRIVAVEQTRQRVAIATVRTVGFDTTLCTPAAALPAEPQPGNILGGTVYLVGSMPALVER